MKILIACEFSGVVRDAFRALGHDAISCDIEPTEKMPACHYRGDVRDILNDGWDMMIAFPPCTHLAISGRAWFHRKQAEQAEAVEFVKTLYNSPIPRVAIENPKGVLSTRFAKPSQIIQPWQHGHEECKGICLWLKNIPLLRRSNVVSTGEHRVHELGQSKNRARERSRTLPGVARAMANQWGKLT